MKVTKMEMGLLKLQAETESESQAICGILEMLFEFMPDAVANFHGMAGKPGKELNWCLVPDGHLDGKCHKKHNAHCGCDCLKPGIKAGIRRWKQIKQWNYRFLAK